MKKIILSALALLPFAAFAQTFTLKGDVKALKTGDKIYLSYVSNGQRITDSTLVSNGTFEFKGTAAADPISANLFKNINPYVKGTNTRNMDFVALYVEPGNITVTSVDSLKSAKATGAPVNDDATKIAALLKPYNDKMTAINVEFAALSPEQKKDKAIMASIQDRAGKILDEMNPIYLEFAKNNPNSYISLTSLQRLATNDKYASQAEASFAKLNESLKSSKVGKGLTAAFEAAKKTAIGITAMNFTQNDASGKAVSLADFKGKYVLVDFWAAWCGPCRAENPNVVAAFNKFKDKNFTVLGISLDGGSTGTTKEDWQAAVEKDQLTWTHVSDLKGWANEVAVAWGVRSIPANFLVDPTGKIVAKGLRAEKLHEKLDELLNNKKTK